MPYRITDHPHHLKVEMTYRPSREDARDLVYAVLEAVLKFGRKPLLVCTLNCGPLSLADLYVVTQHVKDTPLRHGKIAFIYELDPAIESSGFIEGLGVARGLNIAAFRAEPDAVAWLADLTPSGQETV